MNEKEFVLYLERQKDSVESRLAIAEQDVLLEKKRIEVLDSVAKLLGGTLL